MEVTLAEHRSRSVRRRLVAAGTLALVLGGGAAHYVVNGGAEGRDGAVAVDASDDRPSTTSGSPETPTSLASPDSIGANSTATTLRQVGRSTLNVTVGGPAFTTKTTPGVSPVTTPTTQPVVPSSPDSIYTFRRRPERTYHTFPELKGLGAPNVSGPAATEIEPTTTTTTTTLATTTTAERALALAPSSSGNFTAAELPTTTAAGPSTSALPVVPPAG